MGRCQRLELLQRENAGGAVSTDLDVVVGRWHLQDQVPIVGDSHELEQGRPAHDGVEEEVDLSDVEEDALRMVVLRHHECDLEGDATAWDDGARAHTRKWARRGEPRHGNLQLLENCQPDEVEGCPTINQDVVQPDVGDGRGDDQRELPVPRHVLGVV
jgi:hypothetical protein